MTKFLVGSNYFFKCIEGFSSKDVDYLELIDNPKDFNYYRQISGCDICLFQWKRMHPHAYISYALTKGHPMHLGKFLIPEFCKEVGIEFKDLEKLQPLINKLDDKHKYEKIIYDAYIINNDFVLTDEQRMQAYEEYKKYRMEV